MRGKDYKLAVVVFFFYLALIKQGGREGAPRVSIGQVLHSVHVAFDSPAPIKWSVTG